jgi:hypothetical protein
MANHQAFAEPSEDGKWLARCPDCGLIGAQHPFDAESSADELAQVHNRMNNIGGAKDWKSPEIPAD